MKDTILSLLRHALTAGGAIAASQGFLTEQTVTALIGAVIALVGGAWGAIDEFRATRAEKLKASNCTLDKKQKAIDDAIASAGSHGEISLLVGLLCLASLLVGSGCAHITTVSLDNTPRLTARPDFAAAAVASPEWVRDALKTIAQLEYEVTAAAPFGVQPPATAEPSPLPPAK